MRHAGKLAILFLLLPAVGFCQSSSSGSTSTSTTLTNSEMTGLARSMRDEVSTTDRFDSVAAEKRLNMMNAERQKELVADTNKLVQMATELNEEIAHANPGQLTADQLRRVAEIEKLAHTVRDKMSTPVRGFGPGAGTGMDMTPYLPPLR